MWQCDNCGYTDEDGKSFEADFDPEAGENVRYCPECGSDEVYQVDDEDGEEGDAFDEDDDDLIPDEDDEDDDDSGNGWDKDDGGGETRQ